MRQVDLEKFLLFKEVFSRLTNLDVFNLMYKKQSLSWLNMVCQSFMFHCLDRLWSLIFHFIQSLVPAVTCHLGFCRSDLPLRVLYPRSLKHIEPFFQGFDSESLESSSP